MKKNFIIAVFLSLSVICNAQNSNNFSFIGLSNEPKLYTEEEHIEWILNAYTNILHLTVSQKQIVSQTILESYKSVPNSEFYSRVKNENELELLQAMELHFHLQTKFKEILTSSQYASYKQIDPRPEDCYSLSKDYKHYWCSTSK